MELWNTYVLSTKIQQTINYIDIVTESEQRRISTNDEELETQELEIINSRAPCYKLSQNFTLISTFLF